MPDPTKSVTLRLEIETFQYLKAISDALEKEHTPVATDLLRNAVLANYDKLLAGQVVRTPTTEELLGRLSRQLTAIGQRLTRLETEGLRQRPHGLFGRAINLLSSCFPTTKKLAARPASAIPYSDTRRAPPRTGSSKPAGQSTRPSVSTPSQANATQRPPVAGQRRS